MVMAEKRDESSPLVESLKVEHNKQLKDTGKKDSWMKLGAVMAHAFVNCAVRWREFREIMSGKEVKKLSCLF